MLFFQRDVNIKTFLIFMNISQIFGQKHPDSCSEIFAKYCIYWDLFEIFAHK